MPVRAGCGRSKACSAASVTVIDLSVPATVKRPPSYSRSSSAHLELVRGDLARLGDHLLGRVVERDAADGERCGSRTCPCRAASWSCRRGAPRRPRCGTPSRSATICENVVTCPCPCGDVPMSTWTVPVGRQRIVAASQPPARVEDGAEDPRRREAAHLDVGREADAELLRVAAARAARPAPRGAPRSRAISSARSSAASKSPESIVEPGGDRVRELRDEVLAPELDRVHVQLAGERVHRPLDQRTSPRAGPRRGRRRSACVFVKTPTTRASSPRRRSGPP